MRSVCRRRVENRLVRLSGGRRLSQRVVPFKDWPARSLLAIVRHILAVHDWETAKDVVNILPGDPV